MRDQHRESKPDLEERVRTGDERLRECASKRRDTERRRRAQLAAQRRLEAERTVALG